MSKLKEIDEKNRTPSSSVNKKSLMVTQTATNGG